MTGLTPAYDGDAVFFDEAKLVFICRKLYSQDLSLSGFYDKEIARTYKGDDIHRVFVGEIEKMFVKNK